MKKNIHILFIFVSLLFVLIQAQASQENADRPMGSREDKAFFKDNQLWPIDPATGTFIIPVCWEYVPEPLPPEFLRHREMVKKAVEAAWEGLNQRDGVDGPIAKDNRGYSLVDFTGWADCTSSDLNTAVKIRVEDADDPPAGVKSPYVTALGAHLKAPDKRVHLNFTIENNTALWNACDSSLDHCIKVSAVHEFGHVLGLAHENYRSNAPVCDFWQELGDVLEFPFVFEGESYHGTSYFTDYDPGSIMNYCNPNRFKAAGLLPSETDELAVQAFYGGVPTFRNNKLTIPRLVVTGTENSDGVVSVAMNWNPGTKQFKIIPDTYIPSTKPSTATPKYGVSFDIASISFPLVVEYTPNGLHIQRIIEDAKLRHIADGTPYGAFIIDGELKTKSPTTYTMGCLYPESDCLPFIQ
ncbi:MAG: hypothetical protein V3V18_05450 [Methylococcales bacterium]